MNTLGGRPNSGAGCPALASDQGIVIGLASAKAVQGVEDYVPDAALGAATGIVDQFQPRLGPDLGQPSGIVDAGAYAVSTRTIPVPSAARRVPRVRGSVVLRWSSGALLLGSAGHIDTPAHSPR
jgi:hypothetical protein